MNHATTTTLTIAPLTNTMRGSSRASGTADSRAGRAGIRYVSHTINALARTQPTTTGPVRNQPTVPTSWHTVTKIATNNTPSTSTASAPAQSGRIHARARRAANTTGPIATASSTRPKP